MMGRVTVCLVLGVLAPVTVADDAVETGTLNVLTPAQFLSMDASAISSNADGIPLVLHQTSPTTKLNKKHTRFVRVHPCYVLRVWVHAACARVCGSHV
jgi:hypothetical protein